MILNKDIINSARANTIYGTLRQVLFWFIILLYVVIFTGWLIAMRFGSAVDGGFNKYFESTNIDNPNCNLNDLVQSDQREAHALLGLSSNFSADDILRNFNRMNAELVNREKNATELAYSARRQRNATDIASATIDVNQARRDIARLTDAKESLMNITSLKRKAGNNDAASRRSIFSSVYQIAILVFAFGCATLVLALHQALICVIDISDCQIEIHAQNIQRDQRNTRPANTPTAWK